ncbi:MAG: uncharacterized protein K0S94_2821, partial [Nitrospira sp.]|nr:uncharacterized protein [Nitrospira sp.]
MKLTAREIFMVVLVVCVGLFFAIPATTEAAKKSKGMVPAATDLQYAEAISKGDIVKTATLDFACQYRLLTARTSGLTSSPGTSDASTERCWEDIKTAHNPAL